MNNKRILEIVIAFILTILVVIAVWYGLTRRNQPTVSTPLQPSTAENFDPRNPNFTTGIFIQVVSDNSGETPAGSGETRIAFKQGAVESTALISANTQFTKQVKKGQGIEVVAASLKDLKPNALIVVYFHEFPVNQVYNADKIQIISQ